MKKPFWELAILVLSIFASTACGALAALFFKEGPFLFGFAIVGALLFTSTTLGLLVAKSHRLLEPSNTVRKPPGSRLISFVDFLYSLGDVERTFKPILSDWHEEYFRALAAQRKWQSRWINLKYYFRFAQAMGLTKAWGMVDKVAKMLGSVFSK